MLQNLSLPTTAGVLLTLHLPKLKCLIVAAFGSKLRHRVLRWLSAATFQVFTKPLALDLLLFNTFPAVDSTISYPEISTAPPNRPKLSSFATFKAHRRTLRKYFSRIRTSPLLITLFAARCYWQNSWNSPACWPHAADRMKTFGFSSQFPLFLVAHTTFNSCADSSALTWLFRVFYPRRHCYVLTRGVESERRTTV